MRLGYCVLFSALLLTSACSTNNTKWGTNTFERTVGGGAIGAAAGATTGALCCGDPVGDTGKGALIGFAIGALVGFLYDAVHPQ